ncbi:dihydroxyacetone kinase subunit L [Desulfovibrio sp. OttesenSCG-928-C14]|nr:dihydroxyacetone kinase subunit L [Desulfovibrio sp. OttesenSCG-928-C14]
MTMDRRDLSAMLRKVSSLWKENADLLSQIDSRFGDGDHGVTIGKIARLFSSALEDWNDESMAEFLENLGSEIMEIGGGSAGPLYGTLVGGLAGPLAGKKKVDGPLLKKMFASSLADLKTVTKAREGDKTMMDALLPAVEAAQAAPDGVKAVLAAAARAAGQGAEASKDMVAKFGRARSYGEQTLGTKDAGAVSTALFFQGLAEGYKAS